MLRRAALLLLMPAAALADPPCVTAEATVTITRKPDRAKVYLNVESKAGDATGAVESLVGDRKLLLSTLEKLEIPGMTTSSLAQKVTKDKDNSARIRVLPGGPGGQPPVPETYTASQLVVCDVADADPVKVAARVEKIALAAAGMGVVGDRTLMGDSGYYSPYNETRNGARIAWSCRDGWDDAHAKALTEATGKAMGNARALANGAGLKLGDVLSIAEAGAAAAATDDVAIGPRALLAPAAGTDEGFVDGDLVRKVRVVVKVAVGK